MKTCAWTARLRPLALGLCAALTTLAQSAQEADVTAPVARITERNAHEERVELVTRRLDEAGSPLTETNSYVRLE
ncbi:MAG: hypothetical protein HYZ37_10675, partial [Candidatus Solibacter usitatus]|nr:hypothetical protein [Candidatus Solibacter usitatus]